MRKWLSTDYLVPCAIIIAVGVMVVLANGREEERDRRSSFSMPALGAQGAPAVSREGLERRVAEMEDRLAKQPDDVDAAVLLADALLRQARVTGSSGLAFRAGALLKRALREAPAHYGANQMLGAVYLSQHRFREAIEVGEKSRAARPHDPMNEGMIGDAHLELGEYDEAFGAFDRMMQLRPSAAAYARVAYARELQGNLAGALEVMKLAADATSGTDLEALTWHHAQIGELYLQLGRIREAKQEFAIASQAFPGHPFAVSGYARAIEAEGDPDGALTLLRDLVERAPVADLYVRIGDLLGHQGRHEEAERSYALAEAAWRSDMPEPARLARFLADRGKNIAEAVRLAEDTAARRRDIFTEDARAWAYFKAGRIADAKQAIASALRTGSRDRDILAHAAAIHREGT
jgi:tetratricopeptide (TPR) repeat protein